MGGVGIGVARERDIELLMDAEREIAREMGWDPFSDGIRKEDAIASSSHFPSRLACREV